MSSGGAGFVSRCVLIIGRRGGRQPVVGLAEVVEPVAERLQLLVAVLQGVHVLAEGLAAGQGAHGPADVLARGAHARELAIQAMVVVQVLDQPMANLQRQRPGAALTVQHVMRDVAKDPGLALSELFA